MKKGLILEGGAMRGMFTAGVLDVLMENGIEFDGAIGVSAGAAFGCNYKSGQIGRVLRYNTRFCRHKKYCGIGVLLKTGDIYSKDFCYGEVPLQHDVFDFEAYERHPMEFYVVCSDLETGNAVYHKYGGQSDHVFEWIRASASMPLVSNIVDIDGQKMLDGAICDPIPVKYFESIGYNKNIAILTQEKDYRKKKFPMMALFRRIYKKFPAFIRAMEVQHEVYNETLRYISAQEQEEKLFVIRPEERLPVKKVERNPEKLKAAYEIGRKTATKYLSDITDYLNK